MTRVSTVRLAGLALIWGSGFLWIAVALRGFSPVQLVFVRLALGALVLVPLVYAGRGRLPKGLVVWGHLVVAAFFANAVPYLLVAIAEQQIDSSVAGVLNATTPLWTVLITLGIGQQRRLSGYQLTGLVLGFVGTLVLFSPWHAASDLLTWRGAACLAAAASYGVGYVYMDRYLTRRGIPALTLSAAQLIAAAGWLALAVPFAGLQAITWRPDAVLALLILGALGTGVAYVLNYQLITDEGPAASLVLYLLPVVAVILGVLILGEHLSTTAMIGAFVVLVSVALAGRR